MNNLPVGLERNAIVSGDFAQIRLQFLEQLRVSFSLFHRNERMDRGELRITAREHFGAAVQFHSARTLK